MRATPPVCWSVVDPRYVFVDLQIEVDRADTTLVRRLGEYLILGADGRCAARFGWSAPS